MNEFQATYVQYIKSSTTMRSPTCGLLLQCRPCEELHNFSTRFYKNIVIQSNIFQQKSILRFSRDDFVSGKQNSSSNPRGLESTPTALKKKLAQQCISCRKLASKKSGRDL